MADKTALSILNLFTEQIHIEEFIGHLIITLVLGHSLEEHTWSLLGRQTKNSPSHDSVTAVMKAMQAEHQSECPGHQT